MTLYNTYLLNNKKSTRAYIQANNKSINKQGGNNALDNITPLMIVSEYKRINKKRIYKMRIKRQLKNKLPSLAVYTVLSIAGVLLFSFAFTHAIDTHIKNQDTMLCNSAKVSGNSEYLKKCACYYSSADISCLQEEAIK